jgi:hypothetical protein
MAGEPVYVVKVDHFYEPDEEVLRGGREYCRQAVAEYKKSGRISKHRLASMFVEIECPEAEEKYILYG